MRRRKPCAISMREETMLTRVMLRLQAMERMGLDEGGGWETISVPSTSGRRELRMRTGMFFSMAGSTVAGCNTLAPKYASSAASAKEQILTRWAAGKRSEEH